MFENKNHKVIGSNLQVFICQLSLQFLSRKNISQVTSIFFATQRLFTNYGVHKSMKRLAICPQQNLVRSVLRIS